jgi:hypothetical protein
VLVTGRCHGCGRATVRRSGACAGCAAARRNGPPPRGRTPGAYSQAVRVVGILRRLEAAGGAGVELAALALEHGVTCRTLRRDVAALRLARVAVAEARGRLALAPPARCAWCGDDAVARVVDEHDGAEEPACLACASLGQAAS